MPNLECGVKNCSHNSDNKCNLDSIKIEGRGAETTEGTLCSSFVLKKEGYKNSTCDCSPSIKSEIVCDAVNCTYNSSNMCTAKGIDVEGSNACVSGETECTTFKKKN